MLEKIEVDYHLYLKNLSDERLDQIRWAILLFDGFLVLISTLFLSLIIWCLYNSYITESGSLAIVLGVIDISFVFAFIYIVKGVFANDNYREIKGEMINRGLIPVA